MNNKTDLGEQGAERTKDAQGQMEPITSFQGEHRYLSNFWQLRVPIIIEGQRYQTAENAYQALKTLDKSDRARIAAMRPGEAKHAGREVVMRDDWESVKVEVMYEIVFAKFDRNTELREKLLATGNAELIEGNHWGDTFWGVCRGVGENNLGKVLMRARSVFKARQDAQEVSERSGTLSAAPASQLNARQATELGEWRIRDTGFSDSDGRPFYEVWNTRHMDVRLGVIPDKDNAETLVGHRNADVAEALAPSVEPKEPSAACGSEFSEKQELVRDLLKLWNRRREQIKSNTLANRDYRDGLFDAVGDCCADIVKVFSSPAPSVERQSTDWNRFWDLFHTAWGNASSGTYDKSVWKDLQAWVKDRQAVPVERQPKPEGEKWSILDHGAAGFSIMSGENRVWTGLSHDAAMEITVRHNATLSGRSEGKTDLEEKEP